jgi:phage N-6-adenine-methyltransferase
MNEALLSSNKEEWETPWSLFRSIDARFHFDFDAAATRENTKVSRFIPPSSNALSVDWSVYGSMGWLNPPYGRKLPAFLKKAYAECAEHGVSSVVLVPARTDTRWWRDYARTASEVYLLEGRIKFELGGEATFAAPFPSALLVFRPPLIIPANPVTRWAPVL